MGRPLGPAQQHVLHALDARWHMPPTPSDLADLFARGLADFIARRTAGRTCRTPLAVPERVRDGGRMRLVWGEIESDYIQRANDELGRPVALISGEGWPRSAWIHPRWCGITNGTLIRDLHSWEDGRRAVEEYIAGYLAGRDAS